MNPIIIAAFPQTADAVLVNKHFGSTITSNPLAFLIVKGNEAALLAKAIELEAALGVEK